MKTILLSACAAIAIATSASAASAGDLVVRQSDRPADGETVH